MGYTTSTKRAYIQTLIPEDDCPNAPNPLWAWRDDVTRTTQSNDVSSRVRPSGELYKSPTQMTKQYREKTIHGRRLIHRKQWGACPYPTYKYMKYDQLYVDTPSIVHYGPTIDTNWQMYMRNKIKSDVTSLGVAMAEYRQTSLMFQKGARVLRDVWNSVRKKQINRFPLNPCNFAMGHLTYDFGIRPLMGDIHNAAESLGFKLSQPITLKHVVTKKRRTSGDTGSYEWKRDKSDRAIVYVTVSPGKVKPIVVGSAGEIAWEIVPFSFVVDWMFPIGEWLSSLDALDGIDSLTGTLTTKEKYSHKFSEGYFPSEHTITREASYEYESHQRTVLSTIPLPALPTYKPSKSLRNVLQGLSLLTVLRGNCKGSRKQIR